MFKKWSIRLKILMLGVAFLVSLIAMSVALIARFIEHSTLSHARMSVTLTSQLLNLAIVPYTTESQIHILKDYMDEMVGRKRSMISYLLVSDGHSILLSAGQIPHPLPTPTRLDRLRQMPDVLHVRQRILIDSDHVGYVQYGYTTRALTSYRKELIRNGILAIVAELLLAGLSIGLLSHHISKRIQYLNEAFLAIANGDYSRRVLPTHQDELARLAFLFNRMADALEERMNALLTSRTETQQLNASLEDMVAQRTRELSSANMRLEKLVTDLRHTQNQLVQSEKLAALGQLVAGIAHELNTPIGNALTIASTLEVQDKNMQQRMQAGPITRHDFESLLQLHTEAMDLLGRSLQRASSMIHSFKQVSADQVSGQRRQFALDTTIQETLLYLAPSWRKQNVSIESDIAADVLMDSYPGALSQVISNLVSNSLMHAFEGIAQPSIRLTAQIQDGQVKLIFSDNGCGIASEHQHRIFEPFFTTRMGSGGTGLGLHICYNLVTSHLGGRIELLHKNSPGTAFLIVLPLVAPRTISPDTPILEAPDV